MAETGLVVLHGNRLEDLRDLLADYLCRHPLGVLEPERVLVQSNGMKQWLEHALAQRLGVCAATRMELPATALWQIYRSVLGPQAVPAHMPFDKTLLLWRLVRLLPTLCAANPVYAPLARYLGNGSAPRKLYQLAQQVADVLDGYQSYRADWLADWAAGRDQLRSAHGVAQPLAPAHAWQAQLWRDLCTDLGPAQAQASRAAVHARFMAAMGQLSPETGAAQAAAWGLPRRLVVFGISSLPMQMVEALAALGQVAQVLVLVQNPSQEDWSDLLEDRQHLRRAVWRAAQATPGKPAALGAAVLAGQTALWPSRGDGHPLLAAWGKQARDYLHLLDGFDAPERYAQHWSRIDVFVDPAPAGRPASQLAQLQSDILHLRPLPAAPSAQPDDGSLVWVSCHSAQREVEVLHDRLLALLEADPRLQPQQIMVMVPDVGAFAPHIHAVFGRHLPGQPGFIPYHVADTTPRQSPMVLALEWLLGSPQARLGLPEVLALWEVPAVHARLGLTEGDVQRLRDWLLAAGVRWGLDGAHRVAAGLPAQTLGLEQNTWAFGLRRLLLGYALGSPAEAGPAEPDLWCGLAPQAALGSLDARVASGLLQGLDDIAWAQHALQGPHDPARWSALLGELLARFFAPTQEAESRVLACMQDALGAWVQACELAALHTPLALEVVREHWLAHLDDAGLQQPFFGGGVQFGTLMPMRSIPFEVIALLGMNDGDYPRVQAPRDFDLMADAAPGRWRAGDRSRREDDRYLFLEALLAARRTLYLSWQGLSANDATPRPPSVLVAQLLDHVNACWSPPRAAQAQPLQPFSARYFEAGSVFFTFAADWQPVLDDFEQNSLIAPVEYAQEAINIDISAAPVVALTLADLQRLLRHPAQVFFRDGLQVWLDQPEDAAPQDEPFALDALGQHGVARVLLESALQPQALQHLHAQGDLPLAGFGQQASARALAQAQAVWQRRQRWLGEAASALPAQHVALALPGGTPLTGELGALFGRGQGVIQLALEPTAVLQGPVGEPQARGHKLVRLWVQHLAACAAADPALGPVTSVLLGVDGQVLLPPLDAPAALAQLQTLAQAHAHAQALAQPLPVACKTGWAFVQAYSQALAQGTPPEQAQEGALQSARKTFDSGYQHTGERDQSLELQRAFADFDAIAPGLPQWAHTLYAPLLAHLSLSQAVPA
jgi:exodeoxyribonuclease V gamma subunit